MDISTQWLDGVLAVEVRGRIDDSNVGMLADAVHTAVVAKDGAVLMDLTNLAYINKDGLRIFPEVVRRLPGGIARLAICAVPDRLRGVFERTGFDKVFPIYSSRAEALARLAP